jgi:small subunit ribosomal protein S2|tara:strand:- start:595 stop:1194 length:600 start_codon:yes stop_codon:yes gene_type:complete
MAEDQLLVALDDYLKAGIHIGTKFRTKYMSKFIYKVRNDGLSVLNIEQINDRLKNAVNFLSQYDPKDILIVCRRENGWKPVKLFSKLTGIRVITGRYPPGLLTNTDLEDFIEAKLILVSDPWPDKNAVGDAARLGIPVIAMCDTNNECQNVELVIPCNNKGKKSLAIMFWIFAKEYMKNKGLIKSEKDFKYSIDDFTAE